MAEAGPGPSSMASSPVVPGSAKQLRVKRRIVNLVNPADNLDDSDMSTSFQAQDAQFRFAAREATPSPKAGSLETIQTFTPLGFNKDGVKGILRPTGTPGSGNGVRFFPKNRFRVITPNQSLNPPATSPAPTASPAPTSFLSSLLAVAMPTMSPRKGVPAPVEDESTESAEPDESWEQPGQEGEISLVASSMASERSQADISEEGVEEESWTGTPQVHSSPLGLSANLPDVSGENADQGELQSREMELPSDMSDLMGQRLADPSGFNSFSLSDFSRTIHSRPASRQTNLSPILASPELEQDQSTSSDPSRNSMLNDSNPTIRLPLAPLHTNALPVPETPTPGTKPYTSIFADMSAEQAELTWPLAHQASPLRSEIDVDETAFHSALFSHVKVNDVSERSIVDIPRPNRTTPGANTTASDTTHFYDCLSPTPSPGESSLTLSSRSRSLLTPSPTSMSNGLIHPAKALFDAHSAQIVALASELDLYRNLANKLQIEVSERDGLLVNLNLKVIEGEVWRTRVDELERRVKAMRANDAMASSARRKDTSTPQTTQSPAPHDLGDRTTVVEANNRDLEIRLAKALADQEALSRQLSDVVQERDLRSAQSETARASLDRLERNQRDTIMQSRRDGETLRQELETVTKRERTLHLQLQAARDELESARDDRQAIGDLESKLASLQQTTEQLRNEKAEDEEEIGRLGDEIAALSDRLEEESDLQRRLKDMEGEVESANRARKDAERQMRAERQERADLEVELGEVRRCLEEAKAVRLQNLNTPAKPADGADIARLRAESASKDLEIVNLQRRKNELKEDLEMLNIALDSKQQELELMKRKFSVRGVAGSTPLASSRKVNAGYEAPAATPSIVAQTPLPGRAALAARRRSSAAFVTPSVGSMRGAASGKNGKASHVADLWTTSTTNRYIGKVEEENRPPATMMDTGSMRTSARRQRILA